MNRRTSIRCPVVLPGSIGGLLGGAVSLLVLGAVLPWQQNGQLAHPTTTGYWIIGVYGAVIGFLFGTAAAGVASTWTGLLRPARQALLLLVVGAAVGAVGAVLCIPFHAPVPLALD